MWLIKSPLIPKIRRSSLQLSNYSVATKIEKFYIVILIFCIKKHTKNMLDTERSKNIIIRFLKRFW